MSDDKEKQDEKKQLKKIRWTDTTRFRKTRRELLKKYPELMSGIPSEMRGRWIPSTKQKLRARKKKLVLGCLVIVMIFGLFFRLYYYEPSFKALVDTLLRSLKDSWSGE